jgi:hypothetical protein
MLQYATKMSNLGSFAILRNMGEAYWTT